jgi:hypothetical protein
VAAGKPARKGKPFSDFAIKPICGAECANPFEKFTDADDGAENAYLLSVYIDNQLASSLRVHIGSRDHPNVPSLEIFSDVLQPLLRAGRVIIGCTYLVADERLARLYPALPYITFRPCMLAAEYFHGDDLLAAVRTEHQAFYRRAFNFQMLCGHDNIRS